MAQLATVTENKFTKGLLTEFTGLNFPENAMTEADNVELTVIGDVLRRLGLDYEVNSNKTLIDNTGKALNTFIWNNAGGDGITKLFVVQVGVALNFYVATAASTTSPLSNQKILSTVDLTSFRSNVASNPALEECQFASGNGYLFVYHPKCQPFFCSYSSGTVTATAITINIRDFIGVLEEGNIPVTDRPTSLSDTHLYNLINQGWTQGSPWQATSTGSTPTVIASGSAVFTVASGITGTTIGDQVSIVTINGAAQFAGANVPAGTAVMSGVLASYVGTTMTITVTGDLLAARGFNLGPYRIVPYNKGYINTWQAGLGNYPSNSDQWWKFKNSSNVFDPVATINQVTVNTGNAPRGHSILNAFNMDRSVSSSVANLDVVSTDTRPKTGTWFQGRVWYAGTDASVPKQITSDFHTWTANIYFSQVAMSPEQFGMCHQLNDPTSETLFDLLPTDGGVITIPEAGSVYKLFPIQNGLLVFASNGVWYITGSQGIGFAANDYTITKISGVQSISGSSFVDVLGLPYFWNEEGIYAVEADNQGRLQVMSLTHDTIDTLFAEIPLEAKKFARGSYNNIDYVVQWVYKSSDSASITDKYQFDKALNFNTALKSFYPYTFDTALGSIHSVDFVTGPGGLTTTTPTFKYFASNGNFTAFADLHDETFADWASLGGVDFADKSYFVTGYRVHGKAMFKFQVPYIIVYSRTDGDVIAYKVQSIWDYATDSASNRWSSAQIVHQGGPYYSVLHKRVPLRGRGYAMQIKFKSIVGRQFDFIGWSTFETINQGV